MHQEKREEKRYGKKALILVSALTLAANAVIGGTVAWLIAKTDEVTNTFTYGDINITLTETDTNIEDNEGEGDGDKNPNTNTYEMVPGTNITKDPLITVEADSEDSWLFVKLDKSGNFDTFMSYALAEGWTELTGETGVYYRETSWSDKAQEFYVLENNTVTVKKDITKEQLNELDKDGAKNYPTLTVTAYAVQRNASLEEIDTAAEAWALANPAPVVETTEAAE